MDDVMDIRKVKLLGYGLSFSFLLIHIAMFLIFSHYGVVPMAYFNIFSIVFYVFTLLMVRAENLWLYAVSVHLEVVTHMALAVCFVGPIGGFQVTLIGMNALAFYAEYMSIKNKKRRVSGIALSALSLVGNRA